MKIRLLILALALACVPPLGRAADQSKDESAPSDVQDVLYLDESRPVLVRLHVRVDGKPYTALSDGLLQAFFEYLDRDNDGFLNKDEAKEAPNAQTMQQFRQNGFLFFNGRGGKTNLNELDADKDGKVSREEFLTYFRRSNIRPLQVSPAPNFVASTNALTDALFRHLDLNGDGKLTKEEVSQAATTLMQFDQDDDEVVTAQELSGSQVVNQFARGPQNVSPSFLVLEAGEPTLRWVSQLIAQYDKDKNLKLSRTEVKFDKETFDQLDGNHDDELTAEELAKISSLVPDLEMIVRLGKIEGKEPAIERINADRQPRALKAEVRPGADGSVIVALGNAQIDIGSMVGQQGVNNNRQFYMQQFKAAAGALDYVEEKKIPAQFQIIKGIFALVDRDNDGKMTEKELTQFLDLIGKGASSYTSLSVGDSGQGMFEMLDANRDGRLSLRELRNAWPRLASSDKDNIGQITRASLPRQYQVTLARGALGFGANRRVVGGFNNFNPVPVPVTNKGPLWFRKMDRNGDGDLSPREFIGTPEDFKRIDTDGDGLIDAKEAEQAGELLKKSEKK